MQRTLATATIYALFSSASLADSVESTADKEFDLSSQTEAAIEYLNEDNRWCHQFNRKCAGAIIDKTNQKLYLFTDNDNDGDVEVVFETGILSGKKIGDSIEEPNTTVAGFYPHVNAIYNENHPTYQNGTITYPYQMGLYFAHTDTFSLSIHGTLFSGDEENIKDGPENNRQTLGCIRVSVDEASRDEINAFETVHHFFDPSSNRGPYPSTWDLAQSKQTPNNPYHAFNYAQVDTQMNVIVLPEANTSVEYTQQFLEEEIEKKQGVHSLYKFDI